jgi:hypothetical protein
MENAPDIPFSTQADEPMCGWKIPFQQFTLYAINYPSILSEIEKGMIQ